MRTIITCIVLASLCGCSKSPEPVPIVANPQVWIITHYLPTGTVEYKTTTWTVNHGTIWVADPGGGQMLIMGNITIKKYKGEY